MVLSQLKGVRVVKDKKIRDAMVEVLEKHYGAQTHV